MQGDGPRLSWEGHPLWASNTAKHPGAFLAMAADGDLVVYQGDRPIWSSGTDHGGNGRYYLSLQDNGNAIIYSAPRKAIWATNTAVGVGRTELVAGTELRVGRGWSRRTATTGWRCRVTATWSSTGGTPCVGFQHGQAPGPSWRLQADGDLVVYQGDRPIWSSGTDHGGNGRYLL